MEKVKSSLSYTTPNHIQTEDKEKNAFLVHTIAFSMVSVSITACRDFLIIAYIYV